jgi:hypothetical protein
MELRLREDQEEIAERVVNALRGSNVVAVQAPTGWGKTVVGLFAVGELGVKPALWLTPRLAISLHVYNHAVNYFGLKALAVAGRERLCTFGYSNIDFMRGVCHSCRFNRLVGLGELNGLGASMDFGEIKVLGEQMGLCPYRLQSLLERYRDYDVIISHYGRANKLIKYARPRLVILDEAHNVVIPTIHRIASRELVVLLEKLGFEEGEVHHLVKDPESLRIVLRELVDTLIYIAYDDDLRMIVENLLSMMNAQIWYYDPNDEALVGLEIPEIMNTNAKVLVMSATLPPSLLQSANTIIVKRGWSIPTKIDDKYALTIENIGRKGEDIARHVSKYLEPGTVVFATLSREALLSDEVVWEDELGNKTPCDYRDKVVALKAFGRFNEGVNLDCFQRLIVLGLPLLPPNVMMRLRGRGVDERDFVVMKTVQLIGRVIRTAERPSQMPEIVLIDRRFRQFEEELRNYEIEITND